MKRFLFFLLALVMCGNGLWAQAIDIDCFAIDPVEVTPGGHSTILIKVENVPETTPLKSCGFDLYLPDGITIDMDEEDFDVCEAHAKFQASGSMVEEGHYRFVVITMNKKAQFVVGDFMEIGINVSEDYALPTYDATISGEEGNSSIIKIAAPNDVHYQQDAFTFQLIMPMVLDEVKDYESFGEYTGKVTVKRTIGAGKWNTICLPFDMTNDQVTTAFGEGVQIAEFTECKTYTNKKTNTVTGLGLHFTSMTTPVIVANTPYLIQVADDVTSFVVDETTLVDAEPSASVSGGSFVGNYKYIKNLGSEDHPVLFLSGNQFYTAIGNTKLKSFRGYFDLDDLAQYRADKNDAGSNINFFVDDEQATEIVGVTMGQDNPDAVYDLQGRQVKVDGDLNSLQKGVYIINGQKVTVK